MLSFLNWSISSLKAEIGSNVLSPLRWLLQSEEYMCSIGGNKLIYYESGPFKLPSLKCFLLSLARYDTNCFLSPTQSSLSLEV